MIKFKISKVLTSCYFAFYPLPWPRHMVNYKQNNKVEKL